MKKIHKIITSLVLLALMVSCTKGILDKTPLDQLSPDTFYNNETEAKMGLMGLYASIIPVNFSLPWYQYEFMSDNSGSMDWTGSMAFSSWEQNSSSVTAIEKWKLAYQTIVRVNTFLANIEKATMDETIKTQMKAEAMFLRAYMYADLVHFYGDVPLILKVQTLEEAKVARTPKSDVLNAVYTDLDYAAANLPVSYESANIGRATKGAALAFKTRTLLYNENWTEAAKAAKDVMDLGVYDLFPDYEGLFKEENENNKEVIFDIQYIKDLQAQPWPAAPTVFDDWPCGNVNLSLVDAYYMTNGLAIDNPISGYDEQNPYINRDPRMAASIVLPGSMRGSSIFIPATLSISQGMTGIKTRKYADLNNPNKGNCGINTILMRYADILLMRAEALIASGVTTQEVYDLINQVRARVNMPKIETVEGTGLNQEQLQQILHHERRVEFFMEATRYSDIRRWKEESAIHNTYGYVLSKLSDPLDKNKWIFERTKVDTRSFDPAKGWLWPIPQTELQNNEKLTQNPGY